MKHIKKFKFTSPDLAKRFLSDLLEHFETYYRNFSLIPFKKKTNLSKLWMDIGYFLSGNSEEFIESIDKKINLKNNRIISNKGLLYKSIYLFSTGSDLDGTIPHEDMKSLIKNLFNINFMDEDYFNKVLKNYGTIIYQEDRRGIRKPFKKGSYVHFQNQVDSINKLYISTENKDVFFNTRWVLYYFWEHKEPSNYGNSEKKYGVKESLVTFDKDGRIEIGNSETNDKVSSYSGQYSFIQKEGHIYIETDALTINGENLNRHFRLMLYFGKDKIDEIALGVYYNVRTHGALHCGTALLSKIENNIKIDKLQTKKCVIHSNWHEFNNKVIKSYFERRDLNLIKVPNKFSRFKLQELGKAIERLKNNEKKDVRLFEYNCFFSVPLTYNKNNNEVYKFNRTLTLAIEKLLKNKFKFNNNYLACRKAESLEDYRSEAKNGVVQSTFKAISKSEYFILVYPKMKYPIESTDADSKNIKVSSSMIELGYAIGLGKKVIIFCDGNEKGRLPYSILEMNKKEITIIQFKHDSIPNIINKLKNGEFDKESLKEIFNNQK